MSELGNLQRKFVLMVGKLILYAYEQGYELSFGEGFSADGTGHRKGSTHYVGLGQDLNVFKDGTWLDKGPKAEAAHNKMHDFWDKLGGARRIENDLNHYSIEWRGIR